MENKNNSLLLNTDVNEQNKTINEQMLEVNASYKKAINDILYVFVCIIMYFFLIFRGKIFIVAIDIGTWLYLYGALLIICMIVSRVLKFIHIKKLKKKLSNTMTLDFQNDLNTKTFSQKARTLIFIILAIVWFILILVKWSNDTREINVIKLESYNGEIPFATFEDLVPEGSFTMDDSILDNTIEIKSDILAPKVIKLYQHGLINFDDDKVLRGGLIVDYYEACSPWIANAIAREIQLTDKYTNRRYYQVLEAPALDVDYASAYFATFPSLILVKDNKIIHIEFYQTSGNYEMTFEEWSRIFAGSLSK